MSSNNDSLQVISRSNRPSGQRSSSQQRRPQSGTNATLTRAQREARRRRRKKKQMKRIAIRVMVIALFCAIVIGTALLVMEKKRVYDEVRVEAGVSLTVADFLQTQDSKAYFTSDSDDIAVNDEAFVANKVGSYTVYIKSGFSVHKSTLIVSDTVAPQFEVQNIDVYTNGETSTAKASDFVTATTDATAVTYTFSSNPDLTKEGQQEVEIVGTDEGGNQTKKTAIANVVVDTKAPTIKAKNFTAYVGDTISYKEYVTVKDDKDSDIDVKVDNSSVNADAAGTYEIRYKAKDRAGNVAETTATLTLKEHAYTQKSVDALCDKVIDELGIKSKSKRDQCVAIYKWEHENIGYTGNSVKGDWLRGAYEGLTNHAGDCYTYFCVAKALLNRLGIKNMDIERIRVGDSMHFWNLVDLEDGHGWYHFDTTPRKGRPNLCLLTEAELMAYSKTENPESHNYDHSKYPTVP